MLGVGVNSLSATLCCDSDTLVASEKWLPDGDATVSRASTS